MAKNKQRMEMEQAFAAQQKLEVEQLRSTILDLQTKLSQVRNESPSKELIQKIRQDAALLVEMKFDLDYNRERADTYAKALLFFQHPIPFIPNSSRPSISSSTAGLSSPMVAVSSRFEHGLILLSSFSIFSSHRFACSNQPPRRIRLALLHLLIIHSMNLTHKLFQ